MLRSLSIVTLLIACEEAEPEVTPAETAEEITDVESIPTPSEQVEESDSDDPDTEQDNTPDPVTIDYRFSDVDSLLYVQVYKDTSAAASAMAHNHVMRAANWTGSVSYNIDDIDECSMGFSLPVVDLQVDETAMREYVGYGDSISDSDRAMIREHMLADNQLNAASYATISFDSTTCRLENDLLVVTGEMTIAGSTKSMDLDISFSPTNEQFYMSGVIDFTHSDFNITPYSAFWGAVRNSEPLKISFDMVGSAI